MKFQPNSFNSIQLREQTKIGFSYVTRGIIWKINMQELWFLWMARRLDVLDKCMKFCWNTSISNGYQVIERTQNSIANDQREINPKIYKAELMFLCMTRRLNVLYRRMMFHWNISKGSQVIEWTRNSIANDHSKNIQSRVLVLEHDTWSECAL